MAAAVMLVWQRDLISGRLCRVELPRGSTGRDLVATSVPGTSCDFYVTCNGQRIGIDDILQNGFTYNVVPRLYGGKGGFGSMLRALGAQIEKTTNREACRDLSGRRLRDVNHEKAMAEWIKKQAEREAEKEQRRLERLKRKLEEPKHYFTDPEYHRQCSDMSERLEDSVIRGLQASSSSVVSPQSGDCLKRKSEIQDGKGKCKKKKFLWTGMEGLEASSSSGSDCDSDSESPSTSASYQSIVQRLHSSESDSDGPTQCSSSTITTEQQVHYSEGDSDGPTQCSSSTITTEQQVHYSEGDSDGPTQCSSSTITTEQQVHRSEGDSDGPTQCSSSTITTEQQVHRSEWDSDGPTCSSTRIADQGISSFERDFDGPASSSATIDTEENAQLPDMTYVEETTDHKQPVSPSGPTEHMNVTVEVVKLVTIPKLLQESHSENASPFNLLSFSSAVELEALGLEKLKTELMTLGLKCGGTLQERAVRLFSVRGLSKEQINPSLFAKPTKPKKK